MSQQNNTNPLPEPIKKPWYTSWTLWFNILSIAVLAIQYMIDNKILVQYGAYEAMAVAIGNAILRMKTNSQVTK